MTHIHRWVFLVGRDLSRDLNRRLTRRVAGREARRRKESTILWYFLFEQAEEGP
jgi:hypothetical protein